MKNCAVFGCCSNDKKDKIERRFFKFPRDNERSFLWKKFTCGKHKKFDCKKDFICDRHFVETDFFFDKLKKNAVPTRNAPNPKKVKPTEEAKKIFVERRKNVDSLKAALEDSKACAKSKAENILPKKSSPKLKSLNSSPVLNTICTSVLKTCSKDKIINKTNVDVGSEIKHTRDSDYITSGTDSNNGNDIVLTPVTDPPDFIKKKVAELMKLNLVVPKIKLSSSVTNKIAHSDKEFEIKKGKNLPSLNIRSSSDGTKEIRSDLNGFCPSKSSAELTEQENLSPVIFTEEITTVTNSSEKRLSVSNIQEEDEVSQEEEGTSNNFSTEANVSQLQTKKFKSSNLQDDGQNFKNVLKDLILFPESPKKNENTSSLLNDTSIVISGDVESNSQESRNDAFEINSNNNNSMNSTKKSSNTLIKGDKIIINKTNVPLKINMNKGNIKQKVSGIYRNNSNSFIRNKSSPSNLINDEIAAQIKRKNIIVQPHLNKGEIEKKSSGVYKNHPNSLHKNKSRSSNFIEIKIASQGKVDVMQAHLNKEEIGKTSSEAIHSNSLLKNKSCSSFIIKDKIAFQDNMDCMQVHLNKEDIDETSSGEFRNNPNTLLKNKPSSSNFINHKIASQDKVDAMQAHLNEEEVGKTPNGEFRNNPDSLLKNKSGTSIRILINNKITAQNKTKVVQALLNKLRIEKTSSGVFRSNSLSNGKRKVCPLEFEEAQEISTNSCDSNVKKKLNNYSRSPTDGMVESTSTSDANVQKIVQNDSRLTTDGMVESTSTSDSNVQKIVQNDSSSTSDGMVESTSTSDSNVQKIVQNYSSSTTDGIVESTILTGDNFNEPSTSQGNLSPKSFVMQEHLKRVQYLSRKKGIMRKYTKNTFNNRKRLLQSSKYSIAAKAESIGALNPYEKPVDLEVKGEWCKLYLPSLVSKSFPRLNEAYINKMVNVLKARLPKLQPRDKLEVSFLLSVMSAYPGAPDYVKELLTQRLNMLYIATLFQWDTAIALAMEGCDKSGPSSNLTVPSIPLNNGASRMVGIKNPRKNSKYLNPLWDNEKIKVPEEAKKPRTFAYEKIIVERTVNDSHDNSS